MSDDKSSSFYCGQEVVVPANPNTGQTETRLTCKYPWLDCAAAALMRWAVDGYVECNFSECRFFQRPPGKNN